MVTVTAAAAMGTAAAPPAAQRRRRRLGQHFLASPSVARLIVSEAGITGSDTVLEVGTGLGVLTPMLCGRARKVISVEADRRLAERAGAELGGIGNLVLRHGDGFGVGERFSVFVSSLPYSQSRRAVEWLAQAEFSRGVIVVQKEFADKLMAGSCDGDGDGGSGSTPGTARAGAGILPRRRAISVIAGHCFEIRAVASVGRNNFVPPPDVDSVVLGLAKRSTLDGRQIATINRIFSYRKKTVRNILRQFGMRGEDSVGGWGWDSAVLDMRIDGLAGGELVRLADRIIGGR